VVERVAVVGPGGAGKSTFARELGRRTGLPVIHLDQHFWQPGWREPPKDVWRQIQTELVGGDEWVIDGNYGGTFDLRFTRADTVVVLQPSRVTCVFGALRRSLRSRGTPIQAEGCPERLDVRFLRWIWRYPTDSASATR
jgi:adenylate kinase family enzyme